MNKTAIKIGAPCHIDHSKSAYDGRDGIVKRATLDNKGRPASVQVAFGDEIVWFGASVVHAIEQEQAA